MTNWADRTEYQRQRAGLLFVCIAARSTLRSLAVAQRHAGDDPALLREELGARIRINAARRKMAELRGVDVATRFGSHKDASYEAESAVGVTGIPIRLGDAPDREISGDAGLPCPMCGRNIGNAWALEDHVRYSCPIRQERIQS